MMSSWQSVFIYGTLKTGQFNDHVIQDPNRGQARLVGRVRTLEPWPLVSITKFKLTNIPALLDKQGVGKKVFGELYEVDERMLATLDVQEICPELYQRKEIQTIAAEIEPYDESKPMSCWVYVVGNCRPELLELPFLEEFGCGESEKRTLYHLEDLGVDHPGDIFIKKREEPYIYRVFVYGSLKRGQPNHHVFSQSKGRVKFLGVGVTQDPWPLTIAGIYNTPFLLHAKGTGKPIHGEVYEVDFTALQDLDELETCPILYSRTENLVHFSPEDGENATPSLISCWIYSLMDFQPHLLESPLYDNYDSNGSHGLSYVPIEGRIHIDPNSSEVLRWRKPPKPYLYKIFVYGTLKKGQHNHHLLEGATFEGQAVTAYEYPLVIASRYNVPYMLGAPYLGKLIHGEIYSVDLKQLKAMDVLESHPHLYERTEILINRKEEGDRIVPQTETCLAYLLKRFQPHMLDRPFLDHFDVNDPSIAEYIPRPKRDPLHPPSLDVLQQPGLRHLVFTYGSLKKDRPGHKYLTDPTNGERRFVSKARTVEKWPLIVACRFKWPFLLHVQGEGNNIHGEVYEIDDKLFTYLDWYEDHPSIYQRDKLQVEIEDPEGGKKIIECWAYFLKKFKPDYLKRPRLESYDDQQCIVQFDDALDAIDDWETDEEKDQ